MIFDRFPLVYLIGSVIIAINFLVCLTSGLQITDFYVAKAVKEGEDHQLNCRYQLGQGETLYFLRWYKDGNEFFRYMPKETPAHRIYNVTGVRVKTLQSNSTNVILMSVDLSTSGIYRCEVSAEAPGFETADRESDFNVIDMPVGHPFVTVSRGILGRNMNETIVATCSGPEGRLAPQHTWTFASFPVPTGKDFFSQSVQDGISAERLKRTVSSLRLPIDWILSLLTKLEESGTAKSLIHDPYIVLSLRCTSTIYGLFELSDSVDIKIVKNLPSTSAPLLVAPDSRDVVKSTQHSFTSTANGVHTRHGAFTNASSSFFLNRFWNRLFLTIFSLTISAWPIASFPFHILQVHHLT